MPKIQTARVRGASNMRYTGLTDTTVILEASGDASGGDAVWSISPGTWTATTPNAYTATAMVSGLTPSTAYTAQVTLAGSTLNVSFTTHDAVVPGNLGKQAVRRRSF